MKPFPEMGEFARERCVAPQLVLILKGTACNVSHFSRNGKTGEDQNVSCCPIKISQFPKKIADRRQEK